MAELPDLAYNQSIPADWWETDIWTPTRWAYGMGEWGSNWGTGTNSDGCMANNVYMCIKYLKALGWSYQSIMALVANYQSESGLDPRNWEHPAVTSDGFGLPQWTPQSQYQHWAEDIWEPDDPFAPYYYNGWYELYIQASEPFGYPHSQWEKHTDDPQGNPATTSDYYPGYPPSGPPDQSYWLSFQDWCQGLVPSSAGSTVDDRLNYLTGAFYWNYEQVADYVADYSLPQRRNRARMWYDRFLLHFGDFAGRKPQQPNVAPDPDFTMADIKTLYPGWWYKVLYMSSHKQGGLKDYAR